MTRDVRALNRAQKLNLIKLTMLALQAKLYYLQENYNRYHENYSNEAMQLYNASFRFDSAVNNIIQSEDMDYLDDNGLTVMAELSLQVSELYKLGVRTPDDQKEYEATIKQFKEDVYTEALKRLEANKTETDVYENKLISEIGNKDGKNLKGVYEYFDIQKQMTENENKISYAEMTGNNQDYTIYCAKQKEFKRRKEILRQDTPLIAHIYSEETLEKDIRNLCNKIRKAQGKVEKLLNKGKYPIWELNPVIAYIFENNKFYTSDKQEYIFDWIKEQERIDQLVDVFKNAIPIALSVMCFFMPGGVSIAMLILQGANAVAGAAAAYDDIQDAGAVRNMAYSQYPVSEDAQKIIDNTDLSAIERNYAMAILSGAFTMLDFAECVKIARKFGIGDEVMKYFAQGRKFRLSVDETEELVRKAGKAAEISNNKNILLNEEAENLAFGAIHGKDSSDSVVLGKFAPLKDEFGKDILDVKGNKIPSTKSYNSIAKEMDAQYFQLDNWDELSQLYDPEEIWKINEKFLDIQIASGRDIYLTHDPEEYLNTPTFFSKELQYLKKHNFIFKKEGELWHVIR